MAQELLLDRYRAGSEPRKYRKSVSPRDNGITKPNAALESGLNSLEEMLTCDFFGENDVRRIAIDFAKTAMQEYSILYDHEDFNNGYTPLSKNEVKSFTSNQISYRGKEHDLFKSLNYYKREIHRAGRRILDAQDGVSKDDLVSLVDSYKNALNLMNSLIEINVPLVYSMIKTLKLNNSIYAHELISDGLFAIRKSILGFDFNRGVRFSTYFCRAIHNNFIRIVRKGKRGEEVLNRYGIDKLDQSSHMERDKDDREFQLETMKEVLNSHDLDLDDIEKRVIEARFFSGTVTTLEQIGKGYYLSKERIRQIQEKALKKIRKLYLEMTK